MKIKTVASSAITIHTDLSTAINQVYKKTGFRYTDPVPGEESADYGACKFYINSRAIEFRVAKITPTKTGQFITLWKRDHKGPIQPFNMADPIDLFIVSVRNESHFGQFIFPKVILNEKGIVSGNSIEGKRAMRVYAPWDIVTSRQAEKTQQWQVNYFLEIAGDGFTDLTRARNLLNNH